MDHPNRCECGAALLWLKHVDTLKVAPIDAATSPDGNIVALGDQYTIIPKAERGNYEGKLRKNHFASCPDASRFRPGARAR